MFVDVATDGLSNPVGCVGAETGASTCIEFVQGLHQSQAADLDKISHLNALIAEFAGNVDHEQHIAREKLVTCLRISRLCCGNKRAFLLCGRNRKTGRISKEI